MKKTTNIELIERIYHLIQYGPAAENNAYGLMHSALCVDCVDDPASSLEEKSDNRAYYIYHGKGLCERHFQREKNKV